MSAPYMELSNTAAAADSADALLLAQRLEQGEVVCFPECPFEAASPAEQRFLLGQRLAGRTHKNICFNPRSGKVSGAASQPAGQSRELQDILDRFSQNACAWVAENLPGYAPGLQPDRVHFQPEEEATRSIRQTARNDLLHVDAFPTRPTQGRRILRLFVNMSLSETRVWATAQTFGVLLEKFGREVGLPGTSSLSWKEYLCDQIIGIFSPGQARRTAYDAFMVRFHNFLKQKDVFQERCRKRLWKFPPGSAWLVFTDGLAHAALRGRFSLDHSFFIAPENLVSPEVAPANYIEKANSALVSRAA